MKPRPILIIGDVVHVPLTRGYIAVIDAADAAAVRHHNWYALHTPSGKIYAARTVLADGRYKGLLMHRVIIGAQDGVEVDHRDADGLNNRRKNLRECTHQQNMANQVVTRRNKTGLKGVSANKGRFCATIQIGELTHRLGSFATAGEAADAYRSAARALHGDFAR